MPLPPDGLSPALPLLRPARPDDAIALTELYASAFEVPWTALAMLATLMADTTLGVVAEVEGRPVGFVLAQCAADEGQVLTLAVHPAHRAVGVGGVLVRTLLQTARAQGVHRMTLEVAVDNAPALALYRRLGFAPVGMRRGYYPAPDGGARDALVMAASTLADE
jgi:ribosomal-protein-alanine N-acetyltransferase